MFYDIYLNGKKVATVGPTTMEHLSVSVSTTQDEEPVLSSSGLSTLRESGHQTHLTWLEHGLKPTDRVEIVPSDSSEASETRRTRDLRRGVRATMDDRFCDFCKQGEGVVGPIIQAGDTPYICSKCAELCIGIAKELNGGET